MVWRCMCLESDLDLVIPMWTRDTFELVEDYYGSITVRFPSHLPSND